VDVAKPHVEVFPVVSIRLLRVAILYPINGVLGDSILKGNCGHPNIVIAANERKSLPVARNKSIFENDMERQ
jgi:hypothetical protein